MSHHRLAFWCALVLIAAGVLLTLARHHHRAALQQERPDTMWRLEYDIEFLAAVEGAGLMVSLPRETAGVGIFREVFHWKQLGIGVTRSTNGARSFEGYADKPGRYRFRLLLDLHHDPTFVEDTAPPVTTGPTGAPDKFLGAQRLIPAAAPEVIRLARSMLGNESDAAAVIDRMVNLFATQMRVAPDGPEDPRVVATTRRASPRGLARAFTTVARAAGVPARTIAGFELVESRVTAPCYWNEVFIAGRWLPVDPSGAFRDNLPSEFVPVLTGVTDFVRTTEPSTVKHSYSLRQRPLPALLLGDFRRRWTDVFDLDRMSFEIQDILALLLMLPFGAVVTAVFRNLIGLETFGTFSPALIALSFKFADWTTGVLVLVLVLLFGLRFRRLLERLKLLMVPRLGILLSLVVLVLIFSVSVVDHLGWTPGPNAVFLPMVILAGMIERLFITFEEDGSRHCLRLGLGTALVAGCCHLLFHSDSLTAFVVVHPEIHLVTIGALILVGRYVGYRLTELWRFRDLVRAIEKHG